MYHLARVLKVFKADDKEVIGADNTVQAMIEMWDENTFTFMVHPMLNNQIKVHDIVLVEYDFMGGNRQPRQTIVKILRGKTADDSWKRMAAYFDQIKNKGSQSMPQIPMELAVPHGNMVR